METKLQLYTSLLFFFFISGLNIAVAQCDRAVDSLALVALYNATDGANWTNTWDLDMPMDEWYGVELNIEGCIEILDLDGNSAQCCSNNDGNGLSGVLPDEIYSLNYLKFLSLSFNADLTGTLSSNIQNLSNLESLAIRNTSITGTIPKEIGNLANLKNLSILYQNMEGSIPNELNNLVNLERLN